MEEINDFLIYHSYVGGISHASICGKLLILLNKIETVETRTPHYPI